MRQFQADIGHGEWPFYESASRPPPAFDFFGDKKPRRWAVLTKCWSNGFLGGNTLDQGLAVDTRHSPRLDVR
jgi:hypothetical protein